MTLNVASESKRVSFPVIPGVTRLSLPTHYPVGPVNCYVLEGAVPTLIDTGLKHPDSFAALEAGLAEIGLRMSDIKQILLTHAHVDHFGQAKLIQERCEAPLWCHPTESHRVEIPFYQLELLDPCRKFLAESGFGPEMAAMFEGSFHRMETKLDHTKVDGHLHEGMVVQAGDLHLEVLEVPGHAIGELAFVERRLGLMFSGDSLIPGITPNPILDFDLHSGHRYRALEDQMRSLEKLAALPGYRLLPGHHDPIEDHLSLVRMNLRHHQIRLNRLRQLIEEAATPPTTLQLMYLIFPKMQPTDTFLTLSETIGHLDVLEVQGVIVSEPADGVLHWRLR